MSVYPGYQRPQELHAAIMDLAQRCDSSATNILRAYGGSGQFDSTDAAVLKSLFQQGAITGPSSALFLVNYAETADRLVASMDYAQRLIRDRPDRATVLGLQKMVMPPNFVPWAMLAAAQAANSPDAYIQALSVLSPIGIAGPGAPAGGAAAGVPFQKAQAGRDDLHDDEAVFLSYSLQNTIVALSQGIMEISTHVGNVAPVWINVAGGVGIPNINAVGVGGIPTWAAAIGAAAAASHIAAEATRLRVGGWAAIAGTKGVGTGAMNVYAPGAGAAALAAFEPNLETALRACSPILVQMKNEVRRTNLVDFLMSRYRDLQETMSVLIQGGYDRSWTPTQLGSFVPRLGSKCPAGSMPAYFNRQGVRVADHRAVVSVNGRQMLASNVDPARTQCVPAMSPFGAMRRRGRRSARGFGAMADDEDFYGQPNLITPGPTPIKFNAKAMTMAGMRGRRRGGRKVSARGRRGGRGRGGALGLFGALFEPRTSYRTKQGAMQPIGGVGALMLGDTKAAMAAMRRRRHRRAGSRRPVHRRRYHAMSLDQAQKALLLEQAQKGMRKRKRSAKGIKAPKRSHGPKRRRSLKSPKIPPALAVLGEIAGAAAAPAAAPLGIGMHSFGFGALKRKRYSHRRRRPSLKSHRRRRTHRRKTASKTKVRHGKLYRLVHRRRSDGKMGAYWKLVKGASKVAGRRRRHSATKRRRTHSTKRRYTKRSHKKIAVGTTKMRHGRLYKLVHRRCKDGKVRAYWKLVSGSAAPKKRKSIKRRHSVKRRRTGVKRRHSTTKRRSHRRISLRALMGF